MESFPEYLPGYPRVELDLGCGKGGFLAEMATLYPDILFIGVERQTERVEKCRKKARRLGLENMLVFRGDILEMAKHMPEGSVDVIHVLFPDPWPKRRHHSRRLFSRRFLDGALKLLKPGGRLRFMTDDAPYFEAAEILADADSRFQRVEDEERVLAKTDFQRIFESQGKRIHHFVLRPAEAMPSTIS